MKKRILRSEISLVSYSDSINQMMLMSGKSGYVCLVNVHMLVEAWDNDQFSEVVNGASMAVADGMPVAKGLRLLYGVEQARIAGMDLMSDLMAEAERRGKSIFFYGSTDEVLDKIVARSKKDFPDLRLYSYSPPFRLLAEVEKVAVIKRINDSKADFVFVALGCPKQETWMSEHKGKVNSCMVGLGGVFPVYAGDVGRAPLWMQNNGLEWLYRLYKEPRRLWKRYFYTNTKFIFLLLAQFLRAKF